MPGISGTWDTQMQLMENTFTKWTHTDTHTHTKYLNQFGHLSLELNPNFVKSVENVISVALPHAGERERDRKIELHEREKKKFICNLPM